MIISFLDILPLGCGELKHASFILPLVLETIVVIVFCVFAIKIYNRIDG